MSERHDEFAFPSVEKYFEHVARQTNGERTIIPAVSSPMVYTDIEDKIDHLRTRLNRAEDFIDVLWARCETLSAELDKWKAKRKRAKKSSRKRLS